jgi:hypothetical protein
LKKTILVFCILVSSFLYSAEYITKSELQEILKGYVKKELLLKDNIDIISEEKEKIEFYKQHLEGASVYAIYKKIEYLNKFKKYSGSLKRCDYLLEYKKETIPNNTKNKILYICSTVYSKEGHNDKSINNLLILLEEENKSMNNEEIIRKLIDLYKRTGNKDKEIEFENILN